MCSDCYDGCTQITSDKCIRYTGINVPVLDIKTGDSLSYVEQAIVTFLASTLDGTGIKPTIPENIICALVQGYLPSCEDITEVNLFKALIQSVCNLQTQVTAVTNTVTSLNTGFTTGCLSGVSNVSTIKQVVNAIIAKVCANDITLTALALDVSTNYVAIADINSYIAAYLASLAPTTKYYNRMIPYSVVEYYGSLVGNFDGTGAGIVSSNFEKIYLCNGLNGTPDKRGRVGVGITDGTMLGGGMSSQVNPGASPFNPTYILNDSTPIGTNSIILTTPQIPIHNHTATSTVTLNPHTHTITASTSASFGGSGAVPGCDPASTESGGSTNSTIVTGTAATTIANTGSGQAHANNQPALGCYYIIYIP